MSAPRSRLLYGAAVLLTMGAGLASRHFRGLLPAAFGKYPGDGLWALMVFWLFAALAPNASTKRLALGAAGFCCLIECLKLYQAPWAIAVRHTTLGHLVFGHVFSWQNLVAYALGIAIGAGLDAAWRRA